MRKTLLFLFSVLCCINYTYAQVSKSVNVTTPGTLSSLIEDEKKLITDLTVTGSINSADFAIFKQMAALKNLDLANLDCEVIPASAFSGIKIERLILPNQTKIIGESAFSKATFNEKLIIPTTVEIINDGAFQGAILNQGINLTQLINLQTIGGRAFGDVKVPNLDFSKCINLEEIKHSAFSFAQIGDNTIDLSKNEKLSKFGTLGVSWGTFRECTAHVILSNNMTELPSRIFQKFKGTVKLPENLKVIGENAFAEATFNEKLIIPTTVEIINDEAFQGAILNQGINLTQLINLQTIGGRAFGDVKVPNLDFSKCINLEEIRHSAFSFAQIGDNTIDLSKNEKLSKFGTLGVSWGTFRECTAHVILSNNMTELPSRIFQKFKGTVKLPENLKVIGESAFAEATFNEKLIIPTTVEIINDGVFQGTILNQGINLTQLINLYTIGARAFGEVKVPNLDFSKCINLEEIRHSAFSFAQIGDNTIDLSKNEKLSKFGTSGMAWGTFRECTAHVILSDNMTELPSRIFQKFKGTVKLPENLKVIGESAFAEANIKNITIPNSVSFIGKDAFYSCKELIEILSLNSTPPELGNKVFEGVDKNGCTLIIPSKSIHLYATADQWKDFLNIQVYIPEEIPLYFSSTCEYDGSFKDVEHTGIRIGEYLWTNSNINVDVPTRKVYYYDQMKFKWEYGSSILGHSTDLPVTQEILDRYIPCHLMDPSVYQLEDITIFKKYYGAYYTFVDVQYMGGSNTYEEYREGYGQMKEGVNKEIKDWRVPSQGAFAQLFAMCDFEGDYLAEQDVEFALGAKIGDNPLAMHLKSNGQVVGWFDRNKNTFGFNLMPGGARLSVDEGWSNGLPQKGHVWSGLRGDIYHLFQAEYFHTMEDDGTMHHIGIHDYMTFYRGNSQKWINTRYCRRLTPEELGYELYINDELTDIIKLAPSETPPKGYERLRNGYLRGFYVKYMLDNPNPTKTVADILELTRKTATGNTSGEGLGYPKTEEIYLETTPKALLRNALSIEQNNNNISKLVKVYPNPVVDILNIESDDDVISLSILNSTGGVVKKLINCNQTINVSDLPTGVYILKVETEKEITTTKIIKQ